MIDQATVQKIKDTADIVEVVSDYVHLVRRGSNYMGLCPFHNERTPSFSVNKARNFCYCFSCHKGGSPVNFIMEKEGISYHEALLQLAKKYGIKVEERQLTDQEREAQSRREGLFLANEWAMRFFENNLVNTPDGRDIGLAYLYHRGVTDEAIKEFHLGYALDRSGDFTSAALKKGFSPEVLKTLGLTGTSQQGHDYDRFRGRVIFPVLNSAGKVVAFGGRDLKGAAAKYVNSPESELYKKSNELYGMYQARQAIVKEDNCFLVEGYLDVIGMWQAGMKNAVASSGTALTDGQIALIHRFTKNVTLVYDGDAAGIKASLRGMDMLLSHRLDVKLLLLPDGDDPDSFARKHTPEEFRKYVEDNATDIIRYKAGVMMKESANDPQKRIEAIRSVVQSIACIPDKVKRDVYVQECSAIMRIPESSINSEVARAREKVMEEWRRNRNRRKLDEDMASGRIDSTGTRAMSSMQSAGTDTLANTNRSNLAVAITNPLQPLEHEVLVFAIKYGFLALDSIDPETKEDEKNDTADLSAQETVVEYIAEELKIDDVSFSVAEYSLVFEALMQLLPRFHEDLQTFTASLESLKNVKLEEGVEKIGREAMSVAEIKKKEKDLNKEIELWMRTETADFTKSYPSRILASHENDSIRRITTEAISERHKLSKIYRRENPVDCEEDRLLMKIVTSISVWKNGLLESRFNDLIARFRNIAGTGREEEERQMQTELADLIRVRSLMAKNIGDRILSPSPLKRNRR